MKISKYIESMKRITPEWITSLKENEIFVFGCRNSGRHFDGASCFALEHFGAIMGQREGRQCSEMHQNLKMYICHWSFGMNFKKVSLCI